MRNIVIDKIQIKTKIQLKLNFSHNNHQTMLQIITKQIKNILANQFTFVSDNFVSEIKFDIKKFFKIPHNQ